LKNYGVLINIENFEAVLKKTQVRIVLLDVIRIFN